MNKKETKFSAIGFIFASIGAAVGLGNIWRFPEKMVNGGGSSFIIIYFLILLMVCLPIFILELNYGVFFGKGVVKCFAKNNRFIGSAAGWKQTMLITFLSFFYLVVIAWIGIGFVLSFIPMFFKDWSGDGLWFDNTILKSASTKEQEISNISSLKFSPWVFLSIVIILLIVLTIMSAGLKNGLEKANYIFVPGLFVILVGLTVYSLFFLKDGKVGAEVLFDFDFKKMNNGKIWFEATKQGIFSTGILIGILIVFSKKADVRMDKNNEAILVVLFDTFIALIAGLLVVSLISHDVGSEIDKEKQLVGNERTQEIIKQVKNKFGKDSSLGGSQLLFVYLPKLFGSMNSKGISFGAGNLLMMSFTITLLFAALSSIIAMAEVSVDGLQENFQIKKRNSIIIFGVFALIFISFYSTSIGPALVGKQDGIVLLFITIVGVVQLLIFITSPKYFEVIQTNSKYTFLKLNRFNWLRVLTCTITIPFLIILSIFGILDISGVNHILARDHSEYVDWLGLNTKNTSKFTFNLPQLISFIMFGVSTLLTGLFVILGSLKMFNKKTITK